MKGIVSAVALLVLAGGISVPALGQQETCGQEVEQLLEQVRESDLDLRQKGELELALEEARDAGGQTCQGAVTDIREQLDSTQAAQARSDEAGAEDGGEGSNVHVVETDTVAQTGPNEQADAEIRTVETLDSPGRSGAGGGITEEQAPELVGKVLTTRDGEELGEISAVARSAADQRLHALIDVGGVLGLGQRTVAVPLDAAQTDAEGNVRVERSRDEIESGQAFDETQFAVIEGEGDGEGVIEGEGDGEGESGERLLR